jgi:hypothetical protein
LTSYFLLFDIDGVLIEPKGYRKAVFDTVVLLLKEIGEEKLPINEEIITNFEAAGITSEWDMIPLYILCVIEKSFENNIPENKINNHEELVLFLKRKINQPKIEVLIRLISEFINYFKEGFSPSDSLYKKFHLDKAGKPFEYLKRFSPWVVDYWIGNSRDLEKSVALRYFQNLILGSQQYKEITTFDPIIETESYLKKYDLPLINNETHQRIVSISTIENVFMSAITARPSNNPDGQLKTDKKAYFPEAELGLECLSLGEIPCVGYGAMQYLGITKGMLADSFVKPSPVHALAAILHSGGINLTEALNDAYDYLFNIKKNKVLEFFNKHSFPIEIFIFEDSIIGIQSLSKVHDALKSDGINFKFTAFGISNVSNKIMALKKENASIFPTINEAFSTCVEGYFKF